MVPMYVEPSYSCTPTSEGQKVVAEFAVTIGLAGIVVVVICPNGKALFVTLRTPTDVGLV